MHSSGIYAQSKEGFYDEYDMNLRNIPGSEPESEFDERYRTYKVPPDRKKSNFPVTPKMVQKPFDPFVGIPGAGTGSIQSIGDLDPNQLQNNNRGQPLLINPLTGQINEQAMQESLNNQGRDREKKEKDKKKFVEETVYPESKLRRFQIIFFLTMPFALGISAGLAGALAIEKTIGGSILLISGTAGLSGANAYQDQLKMNEHKKKHGTTWQEEEDLSFAP
ncbi:MAG: hypothetical protein Q8T08_18910 [Ignavibacteria bacterium]|nr:hypothetical protein [Ignavibacteria bacterium]